MNGQNRPEHFCTRKQAFIVQKLNAHAVLRYISLSLRLPILFLIRTLCLDTLSLRRFLEQIIRRSGLLASLKHGLSIFDGGQASATTSWKRGHYLWSSSDMGRYWRFLARCI